MNVVCICFVAAFASFFDLSPSFFCVHAFSVTQQLSLAVSSLLLLVVRRVFQCRLYLSQWPFTPAFVVCWSFHQDNNTTAVTLYSMSQYTPVRKACFSMDCDDVTQQWTYKSNSYKLTMYIVMLMSITICPTKAAYIRDTYIYFTKEQSTISK